MPLVLMAGVALASLWTAACGGSQAGFTWTAPEPPPVVQAEGTLPAFTLPVPEQEEPIAQALTRAEQAFIDRMQGFVRQTRVVTRMVSAREEQPFAASILTGRETVGSRTIEHRVILLLGTVEHTDIVRLLASFDFDAPPEEDAHALRLHIHAGESIPERLPYALRTHWSGALERCLHEALIDQPAPALAPIEECFAQIGMHLRDEDTGELRAERLDMVFDALPGRPGMAPSAEGDDGAEANAGEASRQPCEPERGLPCTHARHAWEFGPYETLRAMGFVLTSWAGERWPVLEAAESDDVLASGPALSEPVSGMVFRPGDFPLQAWRAGVTSPFRAWIETVSGHLDPEP